ncbi:DUF4160 domain-containing protein [Olsenella sp. YH-ols2217]|uniref:DUF4160 domain-containing protein n=1 Tax=Kribbibacterium absianum TaxID=3044210 RepID=A0ABT6ZLL6_9ACTN|nr:MULTISPECIES: DUF4160 domain-containing protein [unclassified Olsenella]MDJ1121939.1 DUF4160 domain-containing protein [Olsenella sp. YH-ols2216]MDJ1129947.1 DUF4160 domain-containing protein [Olsenella sp. YH-ols2217]
MPKLFEILGWTVFFWSNEGDPIEPVHVHVGKRPSPDATKVWVTSEGAALLCSNGSRVPSKDLRVILQVLGAKSDEIVERWCSYFDVAPGEERYYC